MINLVKDRLAKAKIDNKIDGINRTNDLSDLDSRLQQTIKKVTDWLATKGINIDFAIKGEKDVKV